MPSRPTDITRGYSFGDFSAAQPASQLPGQNVDVELDRVHNFLDDLIPWLQVSINDDGSLKPGGLVLSTAGVMWRGTYAPATSYAVNDIVFNQQSSWICVSGTPASGVAPPPLPATGNAKWALLAQKGDNGDAPGTSASGITFTPAGTVAATNVQSAIQELDTEKAPVAHGHAISDVTGLTTALANIGKLTNLPAPAQKTTSYTLVPATDGGSLIVFNSASAVSANLPALASAGNAPYFVKSAGTGLVTIDPNGSELIGTAATFTINLGDTIVLIPTATNWEFFIIPATTAFTRAVLNDIDQPTFLSSIGAPSAVAPALSGIVSVEDVIDFNGTAQYGLLDFAPGDKLYYDRTNNLYLFHIGDVEKARINSTGFVGDGSQLTNLPTPAYGGVGFATVMYNNSGATITPGATVGGSSLRYGGTPGGPIATGTWTCRNTANVVNTANGWFERTL